MTADIDTGGAACMNIHDTHSVSLDCDGHGISGHLFTALDATTPVVVQNASAVIITNCSLSNRPVTPTGMFTLWGLDIENSTDIALTNNNITAIEINKLSSGHVSNNQIVGYYAQYNSNNVTISQNSIVGIADEIGAAGIILQGGHSNQALNNTMDGKWDRISEGTLARGWDDGIILDNEAGDLISGNSIQNVWGGGIAASDSLQNTVISNNTIQHAYGCAIGAGWYMDWVGNQVLNNQADDVSQLLTFFYYDDYSPEPPSPTVHFENNRFVANVVGKVNGNQSVGSRSEIVISPQQYIHFLQVQVDHNVLQDNNFGQYAPFLIPPIGFIDGGGNACQMPTDGSPITCHP
ncbi:MAG: right-handed parallel beta-helix repeat-containing protein [Acidobacteriia bacterium]|nr:right-handed parallel beta-helix repeat-containing protein [Terriglobia bacterium]